MHITKVKIVNVGRFVDLSVDLLRGSIGIFGKNGAGKSTLVNLLYALITNDFGRFAGIKTEMIRNTAETKDESYIYGQIVHNGVTMEITRNLKPSKTKPGTVLKVNDEQITDSNKAQAKIYEVLGIDGKMLDLYVFKEQHCIYDFLTTAPSERAKAYQVLCRTEICERLWEELGTYLNKDKELNTEIVDNSDELSGEITELETELTKLNEQKEEAESTLCKAANIEKYEDTLKEANRREVLLDRKASLQVKIKELKKTYNETQELVVECTEALSSVTQVYLQRKSDADDTRAVLKSFETFNAVRKQKKKLLAEKEELKMEEDQKEVPQAPDDADKLDGGRKKLHKMEAELERAKETLELFSENGTTACPTCSTPVADIKGHLEKLRELVKTLPAEIKRVEDKIEAITDYQAEAKKYETWRATHAARKTANENSLAALPSVKAPDGDEDDLREALRKFEKIQAKYTATTDSHQTVVRTAEKIESKLSQHQEESSNVSLALESIDLSDEKIEKAKRRLATHRAAECTIASLSGEIKGVNKQIQSKKDDMKRLKTRLKRTRKLKQMVKVIEAAREVLHRDRLPRRVAQINLSRMEGDINEHLEAFGDPYWVETDDALSFVVHKAGEPPQKAERLSTGQRVVLALAFWPSVASLWSTELGMLALDEPTANLDGENRKLLRDALSGIAKKVRGQQQLIMVTHDPDLRTAFDQVIDL